MSQLWYLRCESGPSWCFLVFYMSFLLFHGLQTFFSPVWSFFNLCLQSLPHSPSACLQPFGITSPRFRRDLNFISPFKKTVKARFPAVLLSEFLAPGFGGSNCTQPRCFGISLLHPFWWFIWSSLLFKQTDFATVFLDVLQSLRTVAHTRICRHTQNTHTQNNETSQKLITLYKWMRAKYASTACVGMHGNVKMM